MTRGDAAPTALPADRQRLSFAWWVATTVLALVLLWELAAAVSAASRHARSDETVRFLVFVALALIPTGAALVSWLRARRSGDGGQRAFSRALYVGAALAIVLPVVAMVAFAISDAISS